MILGWKVMIVMKSQKNKSLHQSHKLRNPKKLSIQKKLKMIINFNILVLALKDGDGTELIFKGNIVIWVIIFLMFFILKLRFK